MRYPVAATLTFEERDHVYKCWWHLKSRYVQEVVVHYKREQGNNYRAWLLSPLCLRFRPQFIKVRPQSLAENVKEKKHFVMEKEASDQVCWSLYSPSMLQTWRATLEDYYGILDTTLLWVSALHSLFHSVTVAWWQSPHWFPLSQ